MFLKSVYLIVKFYSNSACSEFFVNWNVDYPPWLRGYNCLNCFAMRLVFFLPGIFILIMVLFAPLFRFTVWFCTPKQYTYWLIFSLKTLRIYDSQQFLSLVSRINSNKTKIFSTWLVSYVRKQWVTHCAIKHWLF